MARKPAESSSNTSNGAVAAPPPLALSSSFAPLPNGLVLINDEAIRITERGIERRTGPNKRARWKLYLWPKGVIRGSS